MDSRKLPLDNQTETVQLDFLQSDLALCATFVDLARIEVEAGQTDAARRVLAQAEKGPAAIRRFLPRIANVESRADIERRLDELRENLDRLNAMDDRRASAGLGGS
jgi:hypothetical protein